jgi:hypothetical protein
MGVWWWGGEGLKCPPPLPTYTTHASGITRTKPKRKNRTQTERRLKVDDSEKAEEDGCRCMYVVEGEYGYSGVICETYEDADMLTRKLGIDPDTIKEMPVVTFQKEATE